MFLPPIVSWNRLEPRPRTVSFERSLRAEVRDPLWMLCRQWQVGEFAGHDGGTAVRPRSRSRRPGSTATPPAVARPCRTTSRSPSRRSSSAKRSRSTCRCARWSAATSSSSWPVQTSTDLRPALSPGVRLLRAHRRPRARPAAQRPAGLATDACRRRPRHRRWPPARGDRVSAITPTSSPAAACRRPNERRRSPRPANWSPGSAASSTRPDAPEEDAWAPSYLEYQMSVAADGALEGQQTVLDAEGYHHGHLDWYSFDIRDAGPEEGLTDLEPGLRRPTLTPTERTARLRSDPVEFAGMPNLRWWQLEDQQTDFGSLNAGTTDVATADARRVRARLRQRLEPRAVRPRGRQPRPRHRAHGHRLFGERTLVRAAGRRCRRRLAAVGRCTTSARPMRPPDDRCSCAPALARSEGGSPIEEVVLARDEVANMVWGIEAVIPGVRGDGTEGFEAATALTAYLARTQPPPTGPPPVETDAEIRYVLGTTVPENWIPFVATNEPGSNRQIRLQRAAMPRLSTGTTDRRRRAPRRAAARRSRRRRALLRARGGSPREAEPWSAWRSSAAGGATVASRRGSVAGRRPGAARAQWLRVRPGGAPPGGVIARPSRRGRRRRART